LKFDSEDEDHFKDDVASLLHVRMWMAVHGGGITFDARGRRRQSRLKVLAVQESHPYARKVKTKQRIFYLGKY
jgi:hypothetical protein